MDLDLDSLGSPSPGSSTDIDFGSLDAGGADSRPVMDFNLDLPAVGEEKTESQMASVDSVDFDLKFDATETKDTGLEFDLDQISLTPRGGKSEPVLDLERSAPAMPEIDLSSISLDLGGDLPTGGDDAGPRDDKWYDVQTKFDLAKAYQEMGDKEGAREILREVIAEGDSEQQAAAQKVLEALS
jgi:pilus assembly protein FimV